MTEYDERKATQVAAFFISKAPSKKIDKLKLIKLMYIADRESFLVAGEPITYDNYCSLPLGPILSKTYDNMKPGAETKYWGEFIHQHNNCITALHADPGFGSLNQEELEILQGVYKKYGILSPGNLVDITHDFPEYSETSSSIPILYEEIMQGVGIPEKEITQLLKQYSEAAEL